MILFSAEYLGPAKYFSEISKLLEGTPHYFIGNKLTNKFFESKKLSTIREYDVFKNNFLLKNNIRLIITGTHFDKGLDIKIIKYAKKIGIKVACFIDHWTWTQSRIIFINKFAADLIFVLNAHHKKLFLQLGYPNEKIHILGNIIFEDYLKYKKKKNIKLNQKKKYYLSLRKKNI